MSVVPERVRELTLHRTMIGVEGVRALTGVVWPRLEHIDLNLNAIGNEGLRLLGACETMPRTCEYRLEQNGLHPDGIKTFLKGRISALPLRLLDLRYNEMGEEGARIIAESAACEGLQALNLSANEIGDVGVEAVAGSNRMKSLREFSVAGNHQNPRVTDRGAKALGESEIMGSLERLDLSLNRLTWKGVGALLSSETLTSLGSLSLTHMSALDLSRPRGLPSIEQRVPLRFLDLTYGGSSDSAKSAKVLSKVRWRDGLERLVFFGIDFDVQMLDALLSNPTLVGIRDLQFGGLNLTSEVVDVLERAPLDGLECLQLDDYHVKMGAEELERLLEIPWFSGLSRVSVSCEGDEVGARLEAWAADRGVLALT